MCGGNIIELNRMGFTALYVQREEPRVYSRLKSAAHGLINSREIGLR